MTPKLGQLVEYDRQKGAPPVIAVVVECHSNATATIETRCVLDEHDRPLDGFWQRWKFTLSNSELRPARKLRARAGRNTVQEDTGGAGMSRAATRNPDYPVAGAVKSASPTQPTAPEITP